jgi:hypothetical protein
MKNLIQGRIFLVGCPRSGTTLLQSLLAAHPVINSFPESKFFQELVYPGSRRSKFNLASSKARLIFNQFLQDIGHAEMKRLLPKPAFFINQYVRAFVTVLDILTEQEGKSFWLEKTPSHIQRINCIEKWIPEAKFLHIIRNGTDVVASLYEVTQNSSASWSGSRDIDRCINRWLNDVKISFCHLHKPNHFLVQYERLQEQPQLVLQEICQFLNISFTEDMLTKYSFPAQKLIRQHEHWKSDVMKNIQVSNYRKFEHLFTLPERKYISHKISQIDWQNLETHQGIDLLTDCQVY